MPCYPANRKFQVISCHQFDISRLHNHTLWMAVVYRTFSEGKSVFLTFLLDGSPQPQLARVSGGYHCCFNIKNSRGKPTQPCATSGTASGTALLANLHLHASRTTNRSFCGLSAERRESSHDNGSSKILGQPNCLKSALQRKSITCRLACKISKGHTRHLWSLYNWRI